MTVHGGYPSTLGTECVAIMGLRVVWQRRVMEGRKHQCSGVRGEAGKPYGSGSSGDNMSLPVIHQSTAKP